MMDVQGKSDLPIVPLKPSNDAALAAAETGEGRGGAKGNAIQSGMRQTQSWESVSLALDRIRDAARRDRREKFTALLHHVTIELLRYGALQRSSTTWTIAGSCASWNIVSRTGGSCA